MSAAEPRARSWPCPTGAEMRAIERDAIERLGIPAGDLMETAGRAVAEAIARHFPDARSPLIVCGGGNNGGDGYVAARVLAGQGRGVAPVVLDLAGRGSQSPEAKRNRERLESSGVRVELADGPHAISELLGACDLVVDAIFGTGLTRPVEGRTAEVMRALAASGLPCVAVDLPSGLSSETGRPLGLALDADLIVSFGHAKFGLALLPTRARILVAEIGLPAESVERATVRAHVLSSEAARALLPARPLAGHKGSFGHVLVVGGSPGKTGAVLLAAQGALRGGAGLVSLAAPRSLLSIYASRLAEAMCVVLDDSAAGDSTGLLGVPHVDTLVRELASRDALVLGPGLGTHTSSAALARELLARTNVPAVVDADGLNAFAAEPEGLRSTAPRILTPHPGEAARLLGTSTEAIGSDRAAAARAIAARSGAITVLKGARSVIAAPGGEICVNPTGGPGLAAGGSGDVLAGLLGALLAQRLGAWDAARIGTYLHGLAGDLGPDSGGLASELASRIPSARQALLSREARPDEPGTLRSFP